MSFAISNSGALQPGVQYTFSFKPSGALSVVYRPSLSDVTAVIDGVGGVDALAVVVQPASFFSIGSDQFNVTFTYNGDGSDTVESMTSDMLDALSSLSTAFQFIAAYQGGSGTPADTSGVSEDIHAAAAAVIPSTGSLWAIALIAIVVLFFFSGGASVVRRALA